MENYCNIDIFEEASNLNADIFEDFGYFNNGNEEDWNCIDDLGVEAAKGISSLIPHCNQPR